MPIGYDPTRDALYSPQNHDPLWVAGQRYTPLQLAIEAARLAYYRAESSEPDRLRLRGALQCLGFERLQPFDHGGTQAFGAFRPSDGLALVAFRGTQPDDFNDLLADVSLALVPWQTGQGQVHSGFAKAFGLVQPAIADWLASACADRQSLLLTGHSLGAALASLAASVWRPNVLITLGCPRVGDAAFVASLADLAVTRLVDCCDIVARLPPSSWGYAHPEPATLVTHDGRVLAGPSAEVASEDRDLGRLQYLRQYAGRTGNVLLRELADHAPINYARAFFP